MSLRHVSSRSAWCLRHGCECSVDDDTAGVHIAGTPCTAHSPIGLLEKEQSMPFAHFIIWLGMRLMIQEPIIVQENVLAFPRNFLAQYLPMYAWEFVALNKLELGWPIKRDRQWAVCRPKHHVASCQTTQFYMFSCLVV